MSIELAAPVPLPAAEPTTQIEVLLTPKGDGGYRIFSGTLGLTLEAESREAVVQMFKDWIKANWVPGTEVIKVELSPVEHPLAKFAGIMRGDPMVPEWRKAVADYRQEVTESEQAENAQNPLMAFAGDLKDDPLFDEWVQGMAENRAEIDRIECGEGGAGMDNTLAIDI